MDRAEAIEKLKGVEPALKAMGASGLYLFGSTARGEQHVGSDLDLFIDIASDRAFSLLDLAAAQRLLRQALGAPIDLTTRDGLHPRMRAGILHDAEQIF